MSSLLFQKYSFILSLRNNWINSNVCGLDGKGQNVKPLERKEISAAESGIDDRFTTVLVPISLFDWETPVLVPIFDGETTVLVPISFFHGETMVLVAISLFDGETPQNSQTGEPGKTDSLVMWVPY